MEDLALKNLWQAYDQKLEKSYKLNLFIVESIQTQKAKSMLKALVLPKIVGIIIGMAWILFLGALLSLFVAFGNINYIYFFISVLMIMLFNIIAVFGYIKHLVLIHQINYSDNIAKTQGKLALLQASILQHSRIIFLQLPFYTTFHLNNTMFTQANIGLWIIQILVTGSFTWLALFLYRTITINNLHNFWVQKLVGGSDGLKYVKKAMVFLREIEEMKGEE